MRDRAGHTRLNSPGAGLGSTVVSGHNTRHPPPVQSAGQGCFSFCLLVSVSECFLIFYHAKEFLRDQCAGQQPAATDNTYTGCGPINTNKYTACHVPGDTRRGRDKRGIYSSEGGELRTGGLAWHCQHTSVQFLEKVQIAASPAGSCHNHSVILHNYILQISLLALLIGHYFHYWLKITNYISLL